MGHPQVGVSPALRRAVRVVERGTLIEIVRNWKPYPGGPAGSDIVGGRDENPTRQKKAGWAPFKFREIWATLLRARLIRKRKAPLKVASRP